MSRPRGHAHHHAEAVMEMHRQGMPIRQIAQELFDHYGVIPVPSPMQIHRLIRSYSPAVVIDGATGEEVPATPIPRPKSVDRRPSALTVVSDSFVEIRGMVRDIRTEPMESLLYEGQDDDGTPLTRSGRDLSAMIQVRQLRLKACETEARVGRVHAQTYVEGLKIRKMLKDQKANHQAMRHLMRALEVLPSADDRQSVLNRFMDIVDEEQGIR